MHGFVEKIKKEAVERIRQQIGEENERGYKKAFEMVAKGEMNLTKAEELAWSNKPKHEVFYEESEEFIKGFTDACKEILEKARKTEG